MIGQALGNSAATWRVVDREGKVHQFGLNYGTACAMAEAMMQGDPGAGFHTRLDNEPAPVIPPHAALAIKQAAEVAALSSIEPGTERETLKLAIDRYQKAADTDKQTQVALSRARNLLATRQSELDDLTAVHNQTIATDGARLALALRTSDASDDTVTEVDRSALLNAEVRRDTARSAVEHLEPEAASAKSEVEAAAVARDAAIKAVMRSEAETLAQWLEELKQEVAQVQAHISALRYRGVTVSQKALYVLTMPTEMDETAAVAKWRAFGEGLESNANTQLGALQ